MRKTLSLNQNTLFKRLYYRGKPYHSRYVVMHLMRNRLDYNRLGLTVGKKIGKAVRRNRIRRLIHEAYRLQEGQIKSGYDIVLVAKTAAYGKTYQEIFSAVSALLKKADLFVE